ncbi:MAG: DUF3098 domain-containing protein [Bacteroidales bacterium]
MKKKETVANDSGVYNTELGKFAIPKRNIRFIILGLLIMILGYIIMMGGGSKDPNEFNQAMFSSSRTVIAPILILLGMVVEIWAIMYRGKAYKK